jgi:hypothetical protein
MFFEKSFYWYGVIPKKDEKPAQGISRTEVAGRPLFAIWLKEIVQRYRIILLDESDLVCRGICGTIVDYQDFVITSPC